MARTRMVEPGLFLNERLAALPPHARLLFIGLLQLADREGRLEDRPRRIAKEIFPWEEDVDVDELLWQLASRDGLGPKDDTFIVRYVVEDLPLIAISRFLKHQKPHIREAKSVLPPPGKGGKTRVQEGMPKANLGQTLGTPKAGLGGNSASSEEGSTQGKPSASLGRAKASPRRPVLDSDSESVSDPDPDPRKRAKADDEDQIELPPGLEPLVAYVRETWPEIPTPRRAAKAWADAGNGVDLLAVAKDARAYQVSHMEKSYEVPAALLNRFFRTAKSDLSARKSNSGGGVYTGSAVMAADDDGTARAEAMKAKARAHIAEMERSIAEAKKHPRRRNGNG